MIIQIFLFVGVLAILVLVHEFGHFVIARKAGIKVEEFGFGFPPKLFAWKGKKTVYSINVLPFGGFVRLKGEDGEDTHDKDSFASKSSGARSSVLVAGVFMNVILAAVLLSFGLIIGMPSVIENLSSNAIVKDTKIEILKVLPKSSAENAGIKAGEQIVGIIGYETHANDLFKAIKDSAEAQKPVELLIKNNETARKISIMPTIIDDTKKSGIGIAMMETGIVSYPWYTAIYKGVQQAGILFVEVIKGIVMLVSQFLRGEDVGDVVAGPVGIAVITGQVARQGIGHLIQFMAVLSVNLAVLNLIPFPGLDGGRLLFIGIEKMRGGKKVSARVESMAHMIGFLLLLLLVVIVTIRDVSNIGIITSLFG